MIRGLVLATRPQQWVKNLFVLAAVVFAWGLRDPALSWKALKALGLFCMAAGGNYVLNDLIDLERDRLHPRKRHRAIARGEVPLGLAWVTAIGLEVGAVALAWFLERRFAGLLAVYVVLMAAYSVRLRDVIHSFAVGIAIIAHLLDRTTPARAGAANLGRSVRRDEDDTWSRPTAARREYVPLGRPTSLPLADAAPVVT